MFCVASVLGEIEREEGYFGRQILEESMYITGVAATSGPAFGL